MIHEELIEQVIEACARRCDARQELGHDDGVGPAMCAKAIRALDRSQFDEPAAPPTLPSRVEDLDIPAFLRKWPDDPPAVYGPEKQDYPGGPIYRVGTGTGVSLPKQPAPPAPTGQTPRVDTFYAHQITYGEHEHDECAEFARTLERELAAAHAEIERLIKANEHWHLRVTQEKALREAAGARKEGE